MPAKKDNDFLDDLPLGDGEEPQDESGFSAKLRELQSDVTEEEDELEEVEEVEEEVEEEPSEEEPDEEELDEEPEEEPAEEPPAASPGDIVPPTGEPEPPPDPEKPKTQNSPILTHQERYERDQVKQNLRSTR